jgi:flagellar P-ring protein precursor FlgI
MGNATSLAGGVLLITPLTGADGIVYAVSQGPVQVGGYDARAAGSFSSKNQPTSGRVPAGATVEKAVAPDLGGRPLLLQLKRPDFTTASRIAAAIEGALGAGSAKALDPAAVEVAQAKDSKDSVGLLAKIEALEVDADGRARVVVSERTGTVVAGERVRIRPVAVAHGGLTVSVHEQPLVSQPNPFTQGTTATTTRVADVNAVEAQKPVVALPATASVEELVRALNLLGASPRDLVAILQAMKAAGALDADLEVL